MSGHRPLIGCLCRQVSGRKFYQLEDGIQVTVIDGQNGGVVGSRSFSSSLLQGVPAQLEKYIDRLKDG